MLENLSYAGLFVVAAMGLSLRNKMMKLIDRIKPLRRSRHSLHKDMQDKVTLLS